MMNLLTEGKPNMKTLTSALKEITNSLGYSPYEMAKLADGTFVPYADAESYLDQLKQTFVYEACKTVRSEGVENFYKFVHPYPCSDGYILGLMAEIYQRQNLRTLNRLYLGDSSEQYVEFSDKNDLISAFDTLEQRLSLTWLRYYQGLENRNFMSLASMTNEHLVNAWFARMLKLPSAQMTILLHFNLFEIAMLSPQVDGLILGLALSV